MAPKIESADYSAFVKAFEEVQRLLSEIDALLAAAPDREAAERQVVKRFGPLMDQAFAREREAFNRWLEELRGL